MSKNPIARKHYSVGRAKEAARSIAQHSEFNISYLDLCTSMRQLRLRDACQRHFTFGTSGGVKWPDILLYVHTQCIHQGFIQDFRFGGGDSTLRGSGGMFPQEIF